MSVTSFTKKAIIGAAIGAAITGIAITSQAEDKPKPKKEKCYGVTKAGKNDCGSKGLSCAGAATTDSQSNAFVVVPAGLCERLAGGSLEAS